MFLSSFNNNISNLNSWQWRAAIQINNDFICWKITNFTSNCGLLLILLASPSRTPFDVVKIYEKCIKRTSLMRINREKVFYLWKFIELYIKLNISHPQHYRSSNIHVALHKTSPFEGLKFSNSQIYDLNCRNYYKIFTWVLSQTKS
jgi:hypothetical protein